MTILRAMKKSKNSEALKRKIQNLFTESGRKMLNYKQISTRLDLDSSEMRNAILLALKQLEADGIIEEIRGTV